MPGKSLLIISNTFPNPDDSYIGGIFVKEQAKYLTQYFDTVSIISPVAYGIERLRGTSSRDYTFDDIRVFFPRYLNIPFFYSHGRRSWVALETRAILSVIEKEKIPFDLIHAHMTWPSGAVAAELKKQFGVPLVITEHTSTTFNGAVKKRDACWKSTLNAADAIIRVRKGDHHLFQELGVPTREGYHDPQWVRSQDVLTDLIGPLSQGTGPSRRGEDPPERGKSVQPRERASFLYRGDESGCACAQRCPWYYRWIRESSKRNCAI